MIFFQRTFRTPWLSIQQNQSEVVSFVVSFVPSLLSMFCLWFLYDFWYDFYMTFIWFLYAFYMIFIWFLYDFYMISIWFLYDFLYDFWYDFFYFLEWSVRVCVCDCAYLCCVHCRKCILILEFQIFLQFIYSYQNYKKKDTHPYGRIRSCVLITKLDLFFINTLENDANSLLYNPSIIEVNTIVNT